MNSLLIPALVILGRGVFCLPAVLGLLCCILALGDPGVSIETVLLFACAAFALTLASVLAAIGVSRVSELDCLPASFGACVSAASCVALFQSGFIVELVELLIGPGAQGGTAALARSVQVLSRLVWTGSAIIFLFAVFILVIELPFTWLLRAGGVTTPVLLRAYRPLLVFCIVAIAVDFILQFVLHELASPALLAG